MAKSLSWLIIQTCLFLSCTQALPGKEKEEIKAASVIKLINQEQEVILENKIIVGDLDFSQVITKTPLHASLSQTLIKKSVSFTNCQFTGKVTCNGKIEEVNSQSVFMQNLIFNSCEFLSATDFQSVTVFGNVSFTGTQFKDLALFNSFYSHAKDSYFGGITAEKDFSMQDALFVGSCNFFKSKFNGNVSFQGSRFDGLLNFSTVQCNQRADFSKVRLNSNCTFNYTVFAGIARFNQLRSLGMADFVQVKFNKDALFANALFYDICKFNESTVSAAFDFTSAVFYYGNPVFEKTAIADPSLFKAGKALEHEVFVLPRLDAQ
jgi:hypothetical protein